jgi:hypothetical protein
MRAAWAANRPCTQASGGRGEAVSFQVASWATSTALSSGSSAMGRSGCAAIAASRAVRWRSTRSPVPRSKRSAASCSARVHSPVPSATAVSVISKGARPEPKASGSSHRPAHGKRAPPSPSERAATALAASPEVRGSTRSAWNRAGRPASRLGCRRSASTANGRSRCARAARAVARDRASSAAAVGAPPRSVRSTTGFT